MIDIHDLRAVNRLERISVTEHARVRLFERNITLKSVIYCIENGEIIEQYEQDKPFPSCLILGHDEDHKTIHIVVSINEGYIYLITAYYPNPGKWKPDFKSRRKL